MHSLGLLLALFAANKKKKYDPILDWNPPSHDEITETRKRFIDPMKSLTSAIFFSTDPSGKRHESLKHVRQAANKPILFVSNHQLVGIDSWLVVNELWDSGITVRAMTHPFLSNTNNGFSLPGGSLYQNFGCLPVSPRNFYKLMESNQPSLLFPGGARESFHKFNEQYTLTAWSEESDFVRTAAKFDATIFPFSSVGAAESAIFLDPLPFADTLNDALLRATAKHGAPFDARYDAGGELISFPLVVPKPLPSRHYFLFDKPIDLSNVDHKDKHDCSKIYRGIQQTIKRGCNDLLHARKRDPFEDPWRRVAYEQLWRKQAPTFSLDLLNAPQE